MLAPLRPSGKDADGELLDHRVGKQRLGHAVRRRLRVALLDGELDVLADAHVGDAAEAERRQGTLNRLALWVEDLPLEHDVHRHPRHPAPFRSGRRPRAPPADQRTATRCRLAAASRHRRLHREAGRQLAVTSRHYASLAWPAGCGWGPERSRSRKTSSRWTSTERGARMPRRTWSPRTSRTVTTTSRPIMMRWLARRVRTSTSAPSCRSAARRWARVWWPVGPPGKASAIVQFEWIDLLDRYGPIGDQGASSEGPQFSRPRATARTSASL